MKKKNILAVMFDWDATLALVAGNSSLHFRLFHIFTRLGLKYSLGDIENATNTRKEQIEQGILKGKIKPQTRFEILQSYRQIVKILGWTDTSEEFAGRVYEEFGNLPVVVYPDSLSTLQSLTDRGLLLGVISNTSVTAKLTIQKYVGDFIQPKNIIVSSEIGIHKPAKTIFSLTASRIGVLPQNCMYVGDNLDVDAIGAVQNGGYGIGVWLDREEIGLKRGTRKVVRIESLSEILEMV